MKPIGDGPEENKSVAEGNAELEKRSEKDKKDLQLSEDLDHSHGEERRDVAEEIEHQEDKTDS